jgi:hypothetical protein
MLRVFSSDESGAVTTDWVVLTAAIVGMGITSVAAVRTGTGSLGAEIETSLSDSSVSLLGDECNTNSSVGDYKFQTYDEKEQANQSAHLAEIGDTDVQKTFAEVSQKVDWYLQNDPKSPNIAAVVDHAAMVAGELERRGLDYPKSSGDFAQVHERVYGPANTTLCSTSPSSSGTGTAMLMLDSYEGGEVKLKYQEALATYEHEELLKFAEKSAVMAKEAIGQGDQKSAAYQLDLLALAVDEAASREKMLPDAAQYTEVHAKLSGYYNDAFPTR